MFRFKIRPEVKKGHMKKVHFSHIVSIICCVLCSSPFGFTQKNTFPWPSISNSSAPIEVILQLSQPEISVPVNMTKEEKGQLVYESLTQYARRSQRDIIAYLKKQEIPYRSLWLVNALCIEASAEILMTLSEFDEVKSIMLNSPHPSLSKPMQMNSRSVQQEMIPWGIQAIRANQVWDMGFRGEGAVIGGQDTGYDYLHPALFRSYRGFLGNGEFNHDYNWHDAIHESSPLHGDTINPCGFDSPVPCDDGSHGTHTMGIMAGDYPDSLWHIGVAPDAKWIGVRNMDRGFGKPESYLEGFQWFIAPTDSNGENADPAKAPHVINNSWTCPDFEGCTEEHWALFELAIQNCKAAGIMVVASAGNDGSDCFTIDKPPAMFENSFSVGATDLNDRIAGFSSRGPVIIDGSNRVKPNVSAPGVSIFSSLSNNRFGSLSGTSMAGPHVAGAVALIISANPELAGQVDAIESILEETADYRQETVTCIDDARGSEIQNASYGFGRINLLAAIQKATTITSAEELKNLSILTIRPNPFQDELWIDISNDTIEELTVYSIDGRVMYHTSLVGHQLVIPTTTWPNGQYHIRGIANQGVISRNCLKID